jgi:pimeloyl-ACP methyl ester carboxylesterase
VKWLPRILGALGAVLLALVLGAFAIGFHPSWGAGAILHPARRPVGAPPALTKRDVVVQSGDVTLRGWFFPASSASRGITVVYLHGSADNRDSGNWIAERLVPKGYDVLAYDGRAHGESTGDACTYGVLEKHDLRRVLDQLGIKRVLLIGASLGAAVALQAAPDDPRVIGVVAASTFSDLEAIARGRAPLTMHEAQIREAFDLAGKQAAFRVSDASPLRAASRITVPVLIVHGAADRETSPEHSRRVYAALSGPKTLRIVEGAGHNGGLSIIWPEVDRWIDEVLVHPGAERPHATAH